LRAAQAGRRGGFGLLGGGISPALPMVFAAGFANEVSSSRWILWVVITRRTLLDCGF